MHTRKEAQAVMLGNRRVFGLDLLRAIAILMVVYSHGHSFVTHIPASTYEAPALDGVTIFFVLSGFLIGRILLRTVAREDFGAKALAEFWMRRWFRTLPNYFLVTIVLVLVLRPSNPVPHFTFTQNFAWPMPDFFPESWSLSVEEWFYLLTPIPIYLSVKTFNRKAAILFWIFAVIIGVTVFRVYSVSQGGSLDDWHRELSKAVVTRLDSLMYGVLGAYASLYWREQWKQIAVPALACGIAIAIISRALSGSLFYLNYFVLTVGPIATLLTLPFLSEWKHAPSRIGTAITFISVTSYSLYLVHLTLMQQVVLPPLFEAVATKVCWTCGTNPWAQYVMYWVLSILLSWLLYRFFEKPAMELRDRLGTRSVATVTQ
jgi:peptidoglycan/LPS O-acetylase OafA/YrhL